MAFKNVLSLSGGEGARLLLAKIVLEEGNILVLDEPTNHLDIESKESLKNALKDYDMIEISRSQSPQVLSPSRSAKLPILEVVITSI